MWNELLQFLRTRKRLLILPVVALILALILVALAMEHQPLVRRIYSSTTLQSPGTERG